MGISTAKILKHGMWENDTSARFEKEKVLIKGVVHNDTESLA